MTTDAESLARRPQADLPVPIRAPERDTEGLETPQNLFVGVPEAIKVPGGNDRYRRGNGLEEIDGRTSSTSVVRNDEGLGRKRMLRSE
jgi:hypothetical protein